MRETYIQVNIYVYCSWGGRFPSWPLPNLLDFPLIEHSAIHLGYSKTHSTWVFHIVVFMKALLVDLAACPWREKESSESMVV